MAENSERCSSATSKRKRPTSLAWESFEKLPTSEDGKQRAKCMKCSQVYVAEPKSGTSNMLRHAMICVKEFNSSFQRPALDQCMYREKVATAIVKHNLPFSFVEYEGIRDLLNFLHPDAKGISRNTAKSDVLKIYDKEKESLKNSLESLRSRICLTSDLWSSLTTDGYLALTAHYVDENWVLHKKILNFRHIPPPHNGPVLAQHVIHLLQEWGIERKLFSLTLDNASYNDGLVDVLKRHMLLTNSSLCDGEFFHIRCGAHILNLIVQDGLKVIDQSIHKVRESVKYVRGTERRKIAFADCISNLSLSCSKKVRQDVQTRWNSTYLMLESAMLYRRAFDQLQLIDTQFKTCPTEEEWSKIERIARILKPFYEITTLFSGTQYPTANLYFSGVWKIQLLIMEEMKSPDIVIRYMAQEMKVKFDKYWDCYSMILSFAIILDPRYKLRYVEFCFNKLCPETSQEKAQKLREKLYSLFEEYMLPLPYPSTYNPSSIACSSSGGTGEDIGDEMDEFAIFESQHYGDRRNSQLDAYLEEARFDIRQNADLDVLNYWKEAKGRYPELSLMARDILSIPITTVASESTFSVGARIINKYRSCILPSNAEALLCTRDWLFGVPASEHSDEDDLAEDFGCIVANLRANIDQVDRSLLNRNID